MYVNRAMIFSLSDKEYFNFEIYTKRIQVSAETFLIEAQNRGLKANKLVHVHVVGLGLGVWQRYRNDQPKYFLKAFQGAIERLLGKGQLTQIRHIDFSWITNAKFPGSKLEDKQRFADSEIMITFTKRNPFQHPTEKDFLVVAMYAWDGNSFPGGEPLPSILVCLLTLFRFRKRVLDWDVGIDGGSGGRLFDPDTAASKPLD